MQHPWRNRLGNSRRVIVRGNQYDEVKKRVTYNKTKGFRPLMDIKEDYDMDGRVFWVCVMEREKKEATQ